MKRLLFPLLVLLAVEAHAQPADARSCAGCHGSRGEGGLTGAPPIAGLAPGYLARQLAAYADGAREHPVMTPIAKNLTPRERETLDAYYSRLRAPLTPPQVRENGSRWKEGGKGRILCRAWQTNRRSQRAS